MREILAHVHAFVWPIMILFFLISVALPKQKAWNMILRLSYLIMILSGAILLAFKHFPPMLMLKGILAILLIGLMEMTLARRGKQKSFVLFLVIAAIVFVFVLLIGYRVI